MQENPLPPVRPVGLEPTRRKGHQSLNLACLPKFHHGHINVFNFRKANPERPASAPSGTRTHTPHKRGTGPSFRRVYHSTTGTINPASPGGRLGTMRTQYHAHRLARKPKSVTPRHRSKRHTGRTPRSQEAMPCSPWAVHDSNMRPTGCKPGALPSELTAHKRGSGTRTRPRHPCTSSGAHTKTIPLTKTRPAKPCGGQPTALNRV